MKKHLKFLFLLTLFGCSSRSLQTTTTTPTEESQSSSWTNYDKPVVSKIVVDTQKPADCDSADCEEDILDWSGSSDSPLYMGRYFGSINSSSQVLVDIVMRKVRAGLPTCEEGYTESSGSIKLIRGTSDLEQKLCVRFVPARTLQRGISLVSKIKIDPQVVYPVGTHTLDEPQACQNPSQSYRGRFYARIGSTGVASRALCVERAASP